MTGCNELDDNDDDEPSDIFLFTVHLTTLGFSDCTASKPLVEASRSEVWVCGRSLAGIAGSNPAKSRDVCLFIVRCQVEVSASG